MNPYKILQVREDATLEEIEQAYRKKAAKHHPDMGGDDWAFMQVRQAYETLKAKLSGEQATPKASANPKSQAKPSPNSQPNPQSRSGTKTSSQSTQSPNPKRPEEAPKQTGVKQPVVKQPAAAQKLHTAPTASAASPSHGWLPGIQQLFVKPLPLQIESLCFVLLSTLDIVFTGYLIHRGGRELNPIAAWILHQYNVRGLVAFKMIVVACVLLAIHLVAIKHLKLAQRVLWFGCLIVGSVAAYGGWLLNR